MTEANEKPEGNLKSGSALERTYASGHFVITGEIGPPKESSFHHVEMYAQGMKGRVDSVNFTDNQTAVTRLSSWAASVKLIQLGMEPNLQIVCRDRNRLAIQSDLLGAYAHGVRNVLCLSGDHQAFGNHPGCKGVYDVDSIQLINILKRLRDDGCFECGEECKHNPQVLHRLRRQPLRRPLRVPGDPPGEEGRGRCRLRADPVHPGHGSLREVHGAGREARPAQADLYCSRADAGQVPEDGPLHAARRARDDSVGGVLPIPGEGARMGRSPPWT